MATRNLAVLGTTLLLCAGCITLPGQRRGGGQTVGLTDKPVSAKEAPNSLLAADGTRCLVSEQKFREAAEGRKVWCFWTTDVAQK